MEIAIIMAQHRAAKESLFEPMMAYHRYPPFEIPFNVFSRNGSKWLTQGTKHPKDY